MVKEDKKVEDLRVEHYGYTLLKEQLIVLNERTKNIAAMEETLKQVMKFLEEAQQQAQPEPVMQAPQTEFVTSEPIPPSTKGSVLSNLFSRG